MTGSWLVTGGTGSFGHAFVRRLLDGGAERVVVFSRDELKQAQMAKDFDDPRLRFFIGTVTDEPRLIQAMHGVEYVAHAAAMKRIETCEANPAQAVETNVLGTLAVSRACIEAGVRRAVFLSTDKAAHPNTHYGATKLAAERLWTRANVYAAGTPTRFSSTRYGNVANSSGSVIPLFRAQAKAGGPLTITDKRMTRFFMSMAEAVDLVQLAFRDMTGGEVFVPVINGTDIVTLAETVAPGVEWTETGIRPGEKLHETLISEDEASTTYFHGTHYTIQTQRTWEDGGMHTAGEKVPEGFTYRSDGSAMTVDELIEIVA